MTKELSQAHAKLLSTPTAGVPGEHSPYYRKLISAGYKGFLQGSVGGATLYGALGAVVGGIAGLGVLLITGGAAGAAAFAAVPFLAGYGALKGAGTFGSIGSNAAQLAEFAETNERRRAIMERMAETNSPEEAQQLQNMLSQESEDRKPPNMFHWKTLLVGAAIGAAFGAGLAFLAPALHLTAITGFLATIPGGAAAAGGTLAALGGVLGAATGAMLGLDRYYVRRWMDGAELALHDQSMFEELSVVRENEVSKLNTIAKTDEWQQIMDGNPSAPSVRVTVPRPTNLSAAPGTTISNADYQQRVAVAMQHAPAV